MLRVKDFAGRIWTYRPCEKDDAIQWHKLRRSKSPLCKVSGVRKIHGCDLKRSTKVNKISIEKRRHFHLLCVHSLLAPTL